MKLVFDAVKLRQGTFELSLDAEFPAGIHLITGRIGSGKSTLALAAAGILPAAEGEIRREDCTGSPLLLMQFPEYHVTGSTVAAEIRSWNLDGSEAPFSLLGTADPARDPLTLSRGELRRLELACVLAREPGLLILDEPYASLDRFAKPVLTTLLEQRAGITLIFSHEQEFLPAAADRWRITAGTVYHE